MKKIVRIIAIFLLVQTADAQENISAGKHRPLVGAIRWDAWYGELPSSAQPPASVQYPGFDAKNGRLVSQDPGKETQKSLAAEPWRYRWPFFTTLNADGSAKEFNGNSTEIIEKEIEYAVHGGLDYWAFTTYPENCPLSYALKTFITCKNRDKIKFCLYLPMWPAYGRISGDKEEQAYWKYASQLVKQANYLKVEGNRPVVFMGFFNDALAKKVLDGQWRIFCSNLAQAGFGKPYLVICEGSAKAAKKYCDMFAGDAVSSYAKASSRAQGAPFAELAASTEKFWEDCSSAGAQVVPICMTGWDRRTRVMNPVSWESFHSGKDADSYYYKSGTPEEIAVHIGKGVSWFKKHPGQNGTELVLIYAWNELDEGGWLVPALPAPHGQGTARIDALRKVLVTGQKP